jgi:hypothetical protein
MNGKVNTSIVAENRNGISSKDVANKSDCLNKMPIINSRELIVFLNTRNA